MEARVYGWGRPTVSRIVFMVEEQSIKEVLLKILPQVLAPNTDYIVVDHQGKADLDRSIPRKLRAFPKEDKFMILRDQDSADCIDLKTRLTKMCVDAGRPDAMVRIVCHELESWFLGDLRAVEQAFVCGRIASRQEQRAYREPDRLANASQRLRQLVPEYQQISGSKAIATHMNIKDNRSHSFKVFLEGLARLEQLIL